MQNIFSYLFLVPPLSPFSSHLIFDNISIHQVNFINIAFLVLKFGTFESFQEDGDLPFPEALIFIRGIILHHGVCSFQCLLIQIRSLPVISELR